VFPAQSKRWPEKRLRIQIEQPGERQEHPDGGKTEIQPHDAPLANQFENVRPAGCFLNSTPDDLPPIGRTPRTQALQIVQSLPQVWTEHLDDW
jgi:hypothetical protein